MHVTGKNHSNTLSVGTQVGTAAFWKHLNRVGITPTGVPSRKGAGHSLLPLPQRATSIALHTALQRARD